MYSPFFHAVDRAQPQHEVLARALAQREHVSHSDRICALVQSRRRYSPPDVGRDGEAPARQSRTPRTGRSLRYSSPDPVLHVVAADDSRRARNWRSRTGDSRTARAFRRRKNTYPPVRRRPGGWRSRLYVTELRARLDLQPVAADVVGLEVDDVAQRLHPLLARLARQAEHEIDRNVVKARAPRERHGLLRLPVGMRVGPAPSAARRSSDCTPMEMRLKPARRSRVSIGQRHRVGVGLQRDLRVAADVEAAVDLGKNLRLRPAGAEERRRAAAKVDGVDLIAHGAGRGLADVQQSPRRDSASSAPCCARRGWSRNRSIRICCGKRECGRRYRDSFSGFPRSGCAAHRASSSMIHHRASTPP